MIKLYTVSKTGVIHRVMALSFTTPNLHSVGKQTMKECYGLLEQ